MQRTVNEENLPEWVGAKKNTCIGDAGKGRAELSKLGHAEAFGIKVDHNEKRIMPVCNIASQSSSF